MNEIFVQSLDWFNEWMNRTGERPPDFQTLRSMPDLPPLLQFYDGQRVHTSSEWEDRKREICQLLHHYFFGSFPLTPPLLTGAETLNEEREQGLIRRRVRLTFTTTPEVAITIETMTPEGAGPFPVLLTQTTHHAWAVLATARGYLTCVYPAADEDDQSQLFISVYPECDWTTIPRRAWLAGRVLDYLFTLPETDRDHIGITGHSRNGKQSLIATAIDERITAVVSSSSGSAGACPYRFVSETAFEESVEFTTRLCPDWFHPRLRFFTGREDRLPIDIHGLLALIAPRHCLLSTALNDGCETTFAVERSFLAGREVYRFFNKPDSLRIRWRSGGHEVYAEDVQAYCDWFDSAFSREQAEFPDHLMHYFDWESWHDTAQPMEPSPPVAPITDHTASRQAILWSLGVQPPTGVDWRGSYGAEKAHDALMMERPPDPDGITRLGVQFSDYVSGDLYYQPSSRPLPVVIWLHPFSYASGFSGAYMEGPRIYHSLAEHGFAVFAFDQLGFGRRIQEGAHFYTRFPRWSKLGRMIRDVRGAVDFITAGGNRFDYVINPRFTADLPSLDTRHIYCLGYSLGGMVGLYATALDQRIAGVASFSGFTPMRSDTDDKPTGGLRRLWSWHALQPRLGLFHGREDSLPFDFENILGLIAPRSCLVVSPTGDREADADDIHRCIQSVRPAWGTSDRLQFLAPADFNRFQSDQGQLALEWLCGQIKTLPGEM